MADRGTPDRTSLIVRLGLLALLLLGIGSVFGDSLLGMMSTQAEAPTTTESPPSAPE